MELLSNTIDILHKYKYIVLAIIIFVLVFKYYQKKSIEGFEQETPVIEQTYTFTNTGKNGRMGPTQSEIDNAYINTNLKDKVTVVSQGIQEFKIPQTGSYIIHAKGAGRVNNEGRGHIKGNIKGHILKVHSD